MDELREYLAQSMLDSMFGDGLEKEYIWSGVSIKGVIEMSDEEVLKELEIYMDEDELNKARASLSINKVLS